MILELDLMQSSDFIKILYCPKCNNEKEVNMQLNHIDRECKKCGYFPMKIKNK